MHADHYAGDAGGAHISDSALDQQHLLLQRVKMFEVQADLDARRMAQLEEQNKQLEDFLKVKHARCEEQAETLTRIWRTCDDRIDEIKQHHAAAIIANQTTIAKLEDAAAIKEIGLEKVKAEKAALVAENTVLKADNAALKAETATAVSKLEKEKAALEAQVALLQAHTTSKLMDIHTAVTALQALLPPLSPLVSIARVTFDRDWCNAACGARWEVDIIRVNVHACACQTKR
jgi:hypothetical protein